MTSRPNAFGYVVLAGFMAAAAYAVTRKAKAATVPVEVLDCPLETADDFERLERWSIERQLAVVYLPATTEPPLTKPFAGPTGWPIVVVTNDGSFWSYESGKAEPAQSYKRDYCEFR